MSLEIPALTEKGEFRLRQEALDLKQVLLMVMEEFRPLAVKKRIALEAGSFGNMG